MGSGGYVSSHGGCAATGFGEDLIRVLICTRVIGYIEQGDTPQVASQKAIRDLSTTVDGLGGVISLSKQGLGIAFNTKRMAFAYQMADMPLIAGIEPNDLNQLNE